MRLCRGAMMCGMLIAWLCLPLLLPGLAVCGPPSALTAAMGGEHSDETPDHQIQSLLQAYTVAALEEHLYAGEHQHGAEDAYPAAFVVLTSILGAAMTRRLTQKQDGASRCARWAQLSVYGAKLAMLIVPQVGCDLSLHQADSASLHAMFVNVGRRRHGQSHTVRRTGCIQACVPVAHASLASHRAHCQIKMATSTCIGRGVMNSRRAQAGMARPMLFVALAASAPVILYPPLPGQGTAHIPTRAAWLHGSAGVTAVLHARRVPNLCTSARMLLLLHLLLLLLLVVVRSLVSSCILAEQGVLLAVRLIRYTCLLCMRLHDACPTVYSSVLPSRPAGMQACQQHPVPDI